MIHHDVSQLLSLIPPPQQPKNTGTSQEWDIAESRLGVRFPVDFRQLIDTYGSGQFAGYLRLFNPFHKNPYVGFRGALSKYRELLNHWIAEEPDCDFPYGIHPQSPGLLPCGAEENGEIIVCWLTEGHPNDWSIVVVGLAGDLESKDFECGLASFLLRLLNRELDCWLNPEEGVPIESILRFNSH